jgi:hypothetical protein
MHIYINTYIHAQEKYKDRTWDGVGSIEDDEDRPKGDTYPYIYAYIHYHIHAQEKYKDRTWDGVGSVEDDEDRPKLDTCSDYENLLAGTYLRHVCMFTHTCMHTCIHAYMHAYMHT